MGGGLLSNVVNLTCCLLVFSSACAYAYVPWVPSDAVNHLIAAKINPYEAYRVLDALRYGDLRLLPKLNLDLNSFYLKLQEMRIDPVDAYLALKEWTQRYPENRVQPSVAEIDQIINRISKLFSDGLFNNLFDEAKSLVNAINDPERLFQNFFGAGHLLLGFRQSNADAFNAVRNILFGRSYAHSAQCPYGPSPQQPQAQQPPPQPQPQSPPQPQPQPQQPPQQPQQPPQQPQPQQPPQQPQPQQPPQQPQPQQPPQQPQPQQPPQQPQPQQPAQATPPPPPLQYSLQQLDCYLNDPQFADTSRYDRNKDETHVYHKTPQDAPDAPRRTVQNVRHYFDKQTRATYETVITLEFYDGGARRFRRVVRSIA